jgi:hypothetical protein
LRRTGIIELFLFLLLLSLLILLLRFGFDLLLLFGSLILLSLVALAHGDDGID